MSRRNPHHKHRPRLHLRPPPARPKLQGVRLGWLRDICVTPPEITPKNLIRIMPA